MMFVINTCQIFQGIQKQCGRSTQKIRSLTINNTSVMKFQCSGRSSCFLFFLKACRNYFTVIQRSMSLFQKKFDLTYLFFCTGTGKQCGTALVVAANNLLTGSLTAYFIINNTVTCHIDTHICRRFVRAFSHDGFKHCLKNRENLYVTIVVDSSFPISFQMEGVDHIYVVQVSSSCFIGQVYRMFQRNIPDREGLEFGIASCNSTFVFMVELRKTGCHFSASRSWCCNNDQRTGSLDIFVFAVTFVTYDKGDIAWISGDTVMEVYRYAHFFQTFLEMIYTFLTCIACDTHTAYIKSTSGKFFNQTKNFYIVGDSQIATHFVFVNIRSADNNDNFSLITELHQHTEFAVRLKSGKNAGSMVIVKKFPAKFQVKFVVKFADAFPDMLRLHRQIFFVVKSNFHLSFSFPITHSPVV